MREPIRRAFPSLLSLAAITLSLRELSAQESEPPADPLPEPSAEITARELRAHVSLLASDALRGREAGTPDAVRAARYLARVLAEEGLEPAGDDGTFLAAVPLVRWVHDEAPTAKVRTTGGEELLATYGRDFDVFARGAPRSTGPLEVCVVHGPDGLPEAASADIALFLDGPRRETSGWLGARGLDLDGWGLFLRADTEGPRRQSGSPRSVLSRAGEVREGGTAFLTLYGELGRALAAGEVETLELVYHAHREEIADYNVIGRISGVGTPANPELSAEGIVFSAHYDHLGTRPSDRGEDTIYNGADDDASGTAAVLELAQAFEADAPPARTLIFLLAAGEEKGLLGTRQYLEHPAFPLEHTVANLNFEMIGRPDELVGGSGKLWLTGFERSTLGPAFREAGIEVLADARPEQSFFQRSDNYAFAVLGIVAQTLSSYNLHEDYHHVTDEVDTLDYEHMEAATRSAYRAARLLSQGEVTPDWLPGGRPQARR